MIPYKWVVHHPLYTLHHQGFFTAELASPPGVSEIKVHEDAVNEDEITSEVWQSIGNKQS